MHVNPGWTPYRERGALLAAADLGVSAHPDHLESRFAFRTRLLDYLWAGLPIVSTRGDALGDLVERRGLGVAPPPGDPDAFAAACARLLDDDALRERTIAAVAVAADELRWSQVTRPLVDWCLDPPPANRRRGAAFASTVGQQALIAADLLERTGPREVARRAGWALGRTARERLHPPPRRGRP